MQINLQALIVILISCCCIKTVENAAITMTLSCDKESTKEIAQPKNPVSNETVDALLNITKALKEEIAQLKEMLNKLNQNNKPDSVGSSFCQYATSCRHIKNMNPAADDGEYWVNLDQPRKVFCDMTTDGGGWMLVSNIVSQTNQGQTWSLANDIKKISEYSSPSIGLSTTALASLQDHIHFDQLRFFCHKKIPGRTINIATKNNTAGKAVVQFMTGRVDPFPVACGSYEKMTDDNSLLSQHCSQWGYNGAYKVNRWGHANRPKAERLFNHVAFVEDLYHWIVPLSKGGRWECDDYSGTTSIGDTWKIFTR